MSNLLLINKPPGPTSHDIIDALRKITGIKKIGHAGTLDPFAQGLLLVAVGRDSTREISRFVGLDKEYEAVLKLGATSDTFDKTGNITIIDNRTRPLFNSRPLKGRQTEITPPDVFPSRGEAGVGFRNLPLTKGENEVVKITKKCIEDILGQFIGEQEQIPPMFSAKKVGGQRLYKLARQGKEVARKPQKIIIYEIKLKNLEIENWKLEIEVHCSSGTYIRSLAHDIGQVLGMGAYLEKLRRTGIGKYRLAEAVNLEQLTNDNWQKYTLNSNF